MKNKKKIEDKLDIMPAMLGIALMGGLMKYATRGLEKMFGENEKIPKGVVKELMQGAVEGMICYFNEEIVDLKNQIDCLKDENSNLRECSDSLRDDIKKLQDMIYKEQQKNKKKVKKK